MTSGWFSATACKEFKVPKGSSRFQSSGESRGRDEAVGGVTPIFDKASAGSHVNSEPLSTSASSGGVDSSSRLGLQATTLTLNTLTRALNTGTRDGAR
jgi:hypothetical protein